MSEKPSTLAVALEYEKSRAPRVTAIGRGELARRIVELAEANGVPIAEKPELAAMLSRVELDAEIPVNLYRAVAEVLAYVLRIAGQNRSTPRTPPRAQNSRPKAPARRAPK
jgi:flagellar biosynthesis protein